MPYISKSARQVCGGRTYGHVQAMREAFKELPKDTVIVHGGAPGADALAADVANEFGFRVIEISADWHKFGNAAGPIRNQWIVDSGADKLFAFPGGRGTNDMITKCEAAGIPVKRFDTIYPKENPHD